MSVETIKNYFRKAEFYESDMVDPVEDFGNEWQEFHELVGSDSVTFEDFVAIDDNLANTGVQSVEELTEERNLQNGCENESDSDMEDDPVHSYKEAKAFETFRRYMRAHKLEGRTIVKLAHL